MIRATVLSRVHGRTRRPRWLLRSVLLLGLVLGGVQRSSVAEVLTFGWPVPATAEITLHTERAGRAVQTRMLLDVSREPGSGSYRMDYRDVKILSIDGRDISSPEMQDKLPGQVKTVAQAMPSFLVSPRGEISGFIGLESLLETIIDNTPEKPPKVTRERLRKVLFSPEMQKVIRSKAADDWNAWVGIWAGRDLPPGQRMEFTTDSRSGEHQVPARGFFQNMGAAEGRPGAVRLRMELVMDGPELSRGIYRMLSAVVKGSGQSMGDFTEGKIRKARRVQRVEAVTDPKTLRPHSVSSSVEMSFELAGESEAQRQTETKRFAFDWSDR